MNNKLLLGWGISCNAVDTDKTTFVSQKISVSSKFNVNFTTLISEARIFNTFYSVLEEYRKIIKNRFNNIEENELKIIKLYGDYEEIDSVLISVLFWVWEVIFLQYRTNTSLLRI